MSTQRPRLRVIVASTLMALVLVISAAFAAYGFAYRDRLFPYTNTVIVYGRESCGITKAVRQGLTSKGISYVFADVNVKAVDDELWYKLGTRFTEPTITFPIVHVAGRMLLTPSAEQVQDALASVPTPAQRDYSTFLNGADPPPRY